MSEPGQPHRQTADSQMLLGFWYPALRSTQLRRRRLQAVTLLDTPLVVGRTDEGRAFALHEPCPHRGMPLSQGWFDGTRVECSYHGWQFDPESGRCRHIPSLTPDSKLKVERLSARSFGCTEQDGYVWVYFPDPGAKEEPIPPVPRLTVLSSRYRITRLAAELPCGVDHGIIGLMDPAHGPFVHQAWWWRSRQSIQLKEKVFEPIPNGFRIPAHAPSPNSAPYKLLRLYGHSITTSIEFVLPNIRTELIRCGPYWFSSRATVTPLTPERSRIDFCAAWSIFRWFPFVVPVFRLFAKRFLRQDQETMERQVVGLRHRPQMMLIDDADRPARWYFQLKAAYLEAKRTGNPPKHPLAGPVTLRWRS